MRNLTPVLTADEIHLRVKQMAQRISEDYRDRELVLIAVLKGSFIFLADLVRQLTLPVKIDFLQTSSYGADTQTSGSVRLVKDVELDIRGKDVLLIEDIVDTGTTINWVLDHLRSLQPNSIGVCAFIDKRERRETSVPLSYAGHVVQEGFLVGYGLDCAEEYRHLPGIYHLST